MAAEQWDWVRVSRMAQIITRLRCVLGGRTNLRGGGRLGRMVRAPQAGGGAGAGEGWVRGCQSVLRRAGWRRQGQ